MSEEAGQMAPLLIVFRKKARELCVLLKPQLVAEPASCFALLCAQVQPCVQDLLTQRKCGLWVLVLGIRGKVLFLLLARQLFLISWKMFLIWESAATFLILMVFGWSVTILNMPLSTLSLTQLKKNIQQNNQEVKQPLPLFSWLSFYV